jgi:hypothetical protein
MNLTSFCGVPTSVSKYFEKWRMCAKWIKNCTFWYESGQFWSYEKQAVLNPALMV